MNEIIHHHTRSDQWNILVNSHTFPVSEAVIEWEIITLRSCSWGLSCWFWKFGLKWDFSGPMMLRCRCRCCWHSPTPWHHTASSYHITAPSTSSPAASHGQSHDYDGCRAVLSYFFSVVDASNYAAADTSAVPPGCFPLRCTWWWCLLLVVVVLLLVLLLSLYINYYSSRGSTLPP